MPEHHPSTYHFTARLPARQSERQLGKYRQSNISTCSPSTENGDLRFSVPMSSQDIGGGLDLDLATEGFMQISGWAC
ncbi:hypothetical protein PoB_001449000 [Plakobranchus ocellatus]|uniref:Uncharacterized protein n=1 Tax=Plakobranchus ocellatus TaxID=259542 RepID=A0AAV3Z013_9GAST|nr:hypothetical protein PoB_001449000 [Plakobranchus ocellatus]